MENQIEKPKKIFTPLTVIAMIFFFGVILSNFYHLYFKKGYEFIVETPCDVTKEECFQRDCSEEGNCPPNNLATFKRYSLNARDFNQCENEDCTKACETGAIRCEQIPCEEDIEFGESCSTLTATQQNTNE